jgi:hypothetical protein
MSSPDDDRVDVAAVQDEFARALKAYVALLDDDASLLPYRPEHEVTQTEAALTAARLLRAGQLELFELAVFDSWHHG